MSEGWVKLHRKLLDSPVYHRANGTTLRVWLALLLRAQHSSTKRDFCGKVIELQPGQFITGRKELAEIIHISESAVERALKWLQTEQQIEQQKGSKGRIITVTNWATYQLPEQQTEQQENNKRTTREQQADTNKNVKKEKNEKKKTPEAEIIPQLPKHLDDETGRQALDDWITYKKEQYRFTYKPRSLKTLINQCGKQCINSEAFADGVRGSISSGYMGLVFRTNGKGQPARKSMTAFEKGQQILKRQILEERLKHENDERTDGDVIDATFHTLPKLPG